MVKGRSIITGWNNTKKIASQIDLILFDPWIKAGYIFKEIEKICNKLSYAISAYRNAKRVKEENKLKKFKKKNLKLELKVKKEKVFKLCIYKLFKLFICKKLFKLKKLINLKKEEFRRINKDLFSFKSWYALKVLILGENSIP